MEYKLMKYFMISLQTQVIHNSSGFFSSTKYNQESSQKNVL